MESNLTDSTVVVLDGFVWPSREVEIEPAHSHVIRPHHRIISFRMHCQAAHKLASRLQLFIDKSFISVRAGFNEGGALW